MAGSDSNGVDLASAQVIRPAIGVINEIIDDESVFVEGECVRRSICHGEKIRLRNQIPPIYKDSPDITPLR